MTRSVLTHRSDETPGRSAALLNPATDPARVRAMYTHPNHTTAGVGRRSWRSAGTAAPQPSSSKPGKGPGGWACNFHAPESPDAGRRTLILSLCENAARAEGFR